MKNDDIKKIVKKHYGNIAAGSGCCASSCCGSSSNENIAKSIGYSDKEIKSAPKANLGLGCGNPVALAHIKQGDTVLDLGSGAGFDCFLAAEKVGDKGRVIGVDFTEKMIEMATQNAKNWELKNVEFRQGDIEALPVEDNSIDVIISNCVINLAPDKSKVFSESYRVLKKGGKMYVSDIVLLEELDEKTKNNEELLAGCVAGAILKDDYIKTIEKAGLKVNILSEDKEISKRQYDGVPLESLKLEAAKL